MKIILTAGGGGHFSPLLCVYSALPKDTKVLVVGRKHALEGDSAISLEYQTAARLGMSYAAITTGRWQRAFTRHTIPSLLRLPKGFFEAYQVVKNFRPDVVLSFGGYVSIPVVMAAWILRIPVVIHEQTLEAGAANRIASYFAKKVCISWESSKKFFPKEKVVLTGNPIRQFSPPAGGFNFQLPKEKLPVVYVTGGSLGSHAINVLVEGCIKKLLEICVVIHQTGDSGEFRDYDRLSKIKNRLNKSLRDRYILTKFVNSEDVGGIMRWADLVVARSGINTVSELLFFGKPSLLIPLPFSQRDEQEKNAQFLSDLGLAEMAKQNELTISSFYERVCTLLGKRNMYLQNSKRAKEYIITDAEKRIINVVSYASKV